MIRRKIFRQGDFYHVFNKSIANYGIFKDFDNSKRFIQALAYYNNQNIKTNLGQFLKNNQEFEPNLLLPPPSPSEKLLIKFISFCLMPDHYHLLVKILKDDVFSKYISDVENSFSRYFNLKFNRQGPLWQGRFKAVRVRTNEQLLHVSRYIHLNPTTAKLVEKPEDWYFSSYQDFIKDEKILKEMIKEISISNPQHYKKFVEDQKDYQRKLKMIKKLIF